MTPLPPAPRGTTQYGTGSERAEPARRLVPRRERRPRRHHDDDEQEGAAPADDRGQEDRHAEPLLEARADEDQARERGAEGEAGDGRPELHLPLAGAAARPPPAPPRAPTPPPPPPPPGGSTPAPNTGPPGRALMPAEANTHSPRS